MYIKKRLERIKEKKNLLEILERMYERVMVLDINSEEYEEICRDIAGIEFELEEMGVMV